MGTSKNREFAAEKRFLIDISRYSTLYAPLSAPTYASTIHISITVTNTPSTTRFTQNRPPIDEKRERRRLCPLTMRWSLSSSLIVLLLLLQLLHLYLLTSMQSSSPSSAIHLLVPAFFASLRTVPSQLILPWLTTTRSLPDDWRYIIVDVKNVFRNLNYVGGKIGASSEAYGRCCQVLPASNVAVAFSSWQMPFIRGLMAQIQFGWRLRPSTLLPLPLPPPQPAQTPPTTLRTPPPPTTLPPATATATATSCSTASAASPRTPCPGSAKSTS